MKDITLFWNIITQLSFENSFEAVVKILFENEKQNESLQASFTFNSLFSQLINQN